MTVHESLKALLPAWGRRRLKEIRTARRRCRLLQRLQAVHGTSAPSGKYLTYFVMQGMTNRLKGHLMAACYAEVLNRTLVPFWQKTPECAAIFADLFDHAGEDWHYATQKVVTYSVETDMASAEPETLLQDPADLIVLDLDWQYIPMSALLRRLGDKSFSDSFQRTLPVRGDIVRRVDATADAWRRPMVGAQIRRGDFASFGQAHPTNRYIAATEAALKTRPEAGILLTSDARRSELADFVDHFWERCSFAESKSRDDEDGVRDAMYDLLLLSRCRYLI